MVRVCIVKPKIEECFKSCGVLHQLLNSYNIEVRLISPTTIVVWEILVIKYVKYTPEHLRGLRCDCILGVSESEKLKAECGSKCSHLFKDVGSEYQLINEIIKNRHKIRRRVSLD